MSNESVEERIEEAREREKIAFMDFFKRRVLSIIRSVFRRK
jgi:hypothetical protein